MRQPEDDLADRLAELRRRIDAPPGVRTGVLRLPILDPVLDELDAASALEGWVLPPATGAELERLAEVLLTNEHGTSPEAVQRRIRVIELLRRADAGRLPVLVGDPADTFGADLRTILASDEGLRVTLGRLYPVASRATSVAPSARWLRDAAAALAAEEERGAAVDAIRRVLAALLRAELVSRPDILVGGLRLANQRFVRGVLWLTVVAFDEPVEAVAAVGLRMGTSGRSDAVVRDAALANTAAALLGESPDDGAVAALASMRLEITNRVVLKQVDRALEQRAARTGSTVEALVDAALPTLGLDAGGRRLLAGQGATATVQLDRGGRITVTWRDADGTESPDASAAIHAAAPALVADVAALTSKVETMLDEDRRRLERWLGSERAWSWDAWRRRFADHPLGRVAGGTLIWDVRFGSRTVAALWVDGSWRAVDDGLLDATEDAAIRLWHPADATPAAIIGWRATLAARGLVQAVPQADRDVLRPDPGSAAMAADVRFAGAIVEHASLRALLRRRGWAVPALGAWDQGDEATAWRPFDAGLRAELRYQAPERVPTGERVARARIVAVRFVRTDAAPATPAPSSSTVAISDVPARVLSESLLDVRRAIGG